MKNAGRISLLILLSAPAYSQPTPAVEWSTAHGDAQGSQWLRDDAFISPERMQAKSPAFELQWKLQVPDKQQQLNSLTPAVTIGGAGRFPFSVAGGSSNSVHGFDLVSGIETWDRQFGAPADAGTLACPGGIVGSPARPGPVFPLAVPVPAPIGMLFTSYGTTFSGGAGAPGEGIPPELMDFKKLPTDQATSNPDILKALEARMAQPGQEARGGPPAATGPRPGGRGPVYFGGAYVVSSDGILHSLGPLSGKDLLKPVPFLPPNAHASDLVAVEKMLYAATVNGCGGVPNGVWAIDLSGPDKTVTSWKAESGSPTGAPVIGSDGTVFVATDGAPSSIVALDGKTLTRKDWFTQGAPGIVSTPVLFKYKDREIIAAADARGRIVLVDTASPGGADHRTPLAVSAAIPGFRTDANKPLALTSWEDSGGTRWILMPATRSTGGAVMAFKVAGDPLHPTLQQAWVSRNMVSPQAPIVVNGLIFAVSTGEYNPATGVSSVAERVKRSVPAVIYALDANTGKEVWNSGKTITSFVHSGNLWASAGQVFVSTWDNTIYGFGYSMGRH